MEHLKENVEDLSDDKIFEEMMKILQEKSLQKYGKINNQGNSENVSKNDNETDNCNIKEENTGINDEVLIVNEESKEETCSRISENEMLLSNDDVQISEEELSDNEVEILDVEEETGKKERDIHNVYKTNESCEKETSRLFGNTVENPVEIIVNDDDDESLDGISVVGYEENDIELKSAIKSYKSKSKQLQRCPYCPYRANHTNHLQTHIPSIHSSLTCYRCPLCPVSSRNSNETRPPSFSHSQLSALRTHMDRKHRNRKFECPECQKKFTTLWNCEGHIAIRHAEIAERIQRILRMRESLRKSIGNPRKSCKQCPYCEFEGASSSVVRKHVVGKHASWLVYKCTRCDFRAELVNELREHVDEKHYEGEVETDLNEEEVEQVVLIC